MPSAERDHPTSAETRGPTEATDRPAERRGGRRRTYNRRSDEHDPTPPYFEVFERIATALEGIEGLLRAAEVTLPDVETRQRVNR